MPQDKLPEEPGLSRLYRATRRESPSAELDRAVLDEARRALSRHRRRWILPLSTAAVILLGVSLTLTQIEPPRPEMAEPEELRDAGATMLPAEKVKLRKKVTQPRAAPQLQQALPASRDSGFDRGLLEEAEQAEKAEAEGLSSFTSAAKPAPVRPPEVWESHMLDLLKGGDLGALEKELAAFRKAYPDYQLPPELAAMEGEGD